MSKEKDFIIVNILNCNLTNVAMSNYIINTILSFMVYMSPSEIFL